jgi:hypothetical protein
MQSSKALTVRTPPREARRGEIIACAEEPSVNEVIRQALRHYFELKRADADFVGRPQAVLARDTETVGTL